MTKVTDFNNTWCEATENNFNRLDKIFKNISGSFCHTWEEIKKHEFFNDGEGDYFKIERRNVICFFWASKKDIQLARQIKLIDNDFYYADEEKEEDSFNKFGFETPEFEGEILKEINKNTKIGYIIVRGYADNPTYKYGKWDKNGLFYISTDNGEKHIKNFELTPIKKPWYKIEDKFPCLCHLKSIDQNIESFEVLSDINEYKSYNKKFTVRPATKEESLKLVVDED